MIADERPSLFIEHFVSMVSTILERHSTVVVLCLFTLSKEQEVEKMYVLEFRTANRHHTWLRCAICETKAPLERVRRGQTDMMRWRILRLPGTVQAACVKWRSVPLMRYGQKSA